LDHESETGFGWELDDGTHVYTNGTVEGPVLVYVRDGNIVRVEPLKLSQQDPNPGQ